MRSTATILLAALAAAPLASANPYLPLVGFAGRQHSARPTGSSLELRDCVNPCGWHDQYCCGSDQTCITSAGDIAVCTAGGGGGGEAAGDGGGGGNYGYFTTTYVEQGPVTLTSTGSYLLTQVQTPVAGGSPVSCPGGSGSCGSVCCGSGQYCQQPGLCANIGASQSAPIRPTSNAVATATASGSAATTIYPPGSSVPTGVAGNQPASSGLSPGAIAGIVIGVLIGLFLLFLVLACLCCKGIIDGLLALLGCRRKPRRVEETTIIESRHSHHGSGSRPPQRRTWFGMARPGRTEVVEEKKKKSGGLGGLLGVGAVLTAMAVLLGLKRRRDRERSEKDEGSYGSVSYYSYEDDYTTSASEYPSLLYKARS